MAFRGPSVPLSQREWYVESSCRRPKSTADSLKGNCAQLKLVKVRANMRVETAAFIFKSYFLSGSK